jgi:acetyl-CoA synthetase
MITALPGAVDTRPGSATLPFPGIHAEILDDKGKPVKGEGGGFLVLKHPWPGMLRGIWGDPARFKETYWSKYDKTYFAGDGAHRDKNGYFWIMGRIDDVMNVSGHRIGTMEVESALVSSPDVAEAAVVGRPDDLTGTAIVAFVTPKGTTTPDDALIGRLKQHVTKEIGAIARPAEIRFTNALPKTRSGKIMRRLLRDIASGRAVAGDTSTLEDFSVLAQLRASDED